MVRRASSTGPATEDGTWESTEGGTPVWSGGIETPAGTYTPEGDDIPTEVRAAARMAGLSRFRLFINGNQIQSERDLQTRSLKALCESVRVESVSVQRYDRAGCCL